MAQTKSDLVKDEIDAFLNIPDGRRTEQMLRHRIGAARDLVEYIQIHYIDVLESDLAERKADRRRAKRAA